MQRLKIINGLVYGDSAYPRIAVCFHGILSKPGKTINIPVFYLVGLTIIAAFSACLFSVTYQANRIAMSCLEKPEPGDIYVFDDKDESSEFRYSFWKADQIFEDSIYIVKNVYAYDVVPNIMIEDDAFIDTHYMIKKSVLKSLYQNGSITNVMRHYSKNSGFDRLIHVEFASSD